VTTDPIMTEIMAAIAKLHGGDRAGGRSRLEAVWSGIANNPEPFHECVLSHYMADAQDAIAEELAWDIRALDAALRCTDADAQRYQQTVSIPAFMPSLHTNLGEDYCKLGDFTRARVHLESARSCADKLGNDAYGQMIRSGIERLARKLDAINK
jgi:hypothetical protein